MPKRRVEQEEEEEEEEEEEDRVEAQGAEPAAFCSNRRAVT